MRVGAYVQRLHAMSLKDNSFTVDMYLWFRWNPEDFAKKGDDAPKLPFETFEVVGASSVEKEVQSQADGYAALRVKAQITQFWRVDGFPFDDHVLEVVVEDYASETHLLRYEVDARGSQIAPDFQAPGFMARPLETQTATHEYRTSFGDPNLPAENRSEYGRVVFRVPLVRAGWGMFLKLFTGLFVSVGIAFVAFFVRPSEVDPRFGLPVGAMFAAVASEYVVASSLPDSGSVTLADRLHLVSFVAILIVVIESARSLHLIQRGDDEAEARVRRLDRVSFLVVATLWGGAVAWLVASTLRVAR